MNNRHKAEDVGVNHEGYSAGRYSQGPLWLLKLFLDGHWFNIPAEDVGGDHEGYSAAS